MPGGDPANMKCSVCAQLHVSSTDNMAAAMILLVVGLLMAGTIYQALRKLLFQMSGPGLHGQVHEFRKPIFTTVQSAFGPSLCLLYIIITAALQRRRQRASARKAVAGAGAEVTQPLLAESKDDGTPCQSDTLAHEDRLEDNSAGLDPLPPVAGSDAVHHVPFHPAMRNDEYEKGTYEWQGPRWSSVGRVVLPAIAGVMSGGLQGAGLVYLSASASQMLTGSLILFAAVLSRWILGRRLNKLHYMGIGMITLGVTAVAASSLLLAADTPGPSGPAKVSAALVLVGMLLTLLSQLIGALQLVLEELLMGDVHMHPFEVLGWEGIIGTLFMLAILGLATVVPGSDVDHELENFEDSIIMMRNLPAVLGLDIGVFISSILVNILGVYVTVYLGSVFRAVLTVTRTGFIWLVNVALFYSPLGHHKLGEAVSPVASTVQLIGFALTVGGTLLYAQGTTRVAQAKQAMQAAHADPESEQGKVILRQVYYPAHSSSRQIRRSDSFQRLDHATTEVTRGSPLLARSSWVLEPEQINPNRLGTSRFRDAFIPRLPVRVLSAGTLETLAGNMSHL